MMSSRLLILSLLWSSCQAAGLRARNDRQLSLTTTTALNCSQELSFEILCQGDCNFTARQGTCESKMFQYHGGPCRSSSTTARSNSDSAANCQDLHQGPPTAVGDDVFVVISDAADPLKNSSMWTQVGGFFWTDYRDYPIGLGLSDQQNITFYSSNETVTYDTMLQTMLFYAPCEGTPLSHLDQGQSVQLFATAVDPKIRTLFHLHIQSLTQQQWQLTSVSATTSVEPLHQDLVISELQSTVGDVRVPLVLEMDRNDTLSILSTAQVLTASGLECGVSAFYHSGTTTAAPATKAWP